MAQAAVESTDPAEKAELLRALPEPVGGALHGGRRARSARRVPGVIDQLRSMEFGAGSQINIPIAVLIWLMIIPMMMKVDFASIRNVGKPAARPARDPVRELAGEAVLDGARSPGCSSGIVFAAWISPADADQYIAGCIILAAAPCTAMVFVWSYLTDGDPAYTLVQVSVNDLIMLFLFAPIVRFLVSGASSLHVPFQVLLYAVVHLHRHSAGGGLGAPRAGSSARTGSEWFEKTPAAALRAGQHARAAGHAGADLRVPGRQHHREAVSRRADRHSDPDAGVFQLVADLRADAAVQGAPCRGRAGRADRRQQLLRAGRGDGHRAVRAWFGRRAGDGRRRADRGAGDALGLLVLQPHAALVSRNGAR